MQEPLPMLTVGNISVPYEAVADFCRRHRIRELSLFGSVLRDDFTDQSDVDVLIEPGPGHERTLNEVLTMKEDLEAMFGRRVDLVYADLLNKYIRDEVLGMRKVIYFFPQ